MIDLFAGAGGMTRGFVEAKGFKPVSAVEQELQPAATYAANFGDDHIFHGDIADYTDVPKVDLVVGGPPCQGFSNLGKKDPKDARNKLWSEFVRVVEACEADVFVFENVERFSRSAEFDLLKGETAKDGKLADFEVRLFTLNAADFGVPQKRIRSVIVGSRCGTPTAPLPTHDRKRAGGLPAWLTVEDAIGELDWYVGDLPLPDARREFSGKKIGGEYKLADIHVSRRYDPTSIARFEYVPPGGNRFDLPWILKTPGWRKHHTGAGDVMGRLVWDQPSVTIRCEFHKPEKGRYLHPQWEKDGEQVNRALTPAEGALLQGFSDDHVWCGSKTGIAKQIGNAVPPPMAKAIALSVKTLLRSRDDR
jgi:DNA (cytosine-5)-methyltransferase 1